MQPIQLIPLGSSLGERREKDSSKPDILSSAASEMDLLKGCKIKYT